jgi:hypothetical protein
MVTNRCIATGVGLALYAVIGFVTMLITFIPSSSLLCDLLFMIIGLTSFFWGFWALLHWIDYVEKPQSREKIDDYIDHYHERLDTIIHHFKTQPTNFKIMTSLFVLLYGIITGCLLGRLADSKPEYKFINFCMIIHSFVIALSGLFGVLCPLYEFIFITHQDKTFQDHFDIFYYGYTKTKFNKQQKEKNAKEEKEMKEQIALLKEAIKMPATKLEDYFTRGYNEGILHCMTNEHFHQGYFVDETYPPYNRVFEEQLQKSLEQIINCQPRTNETEVFGYCFGVLSQRYKYSNKFDKNYPDMCKYFANENWVRLQECVEEFKEFFMYN